MKNLTNNKCWICADTAETAEHKIKSSDLKLMFPEYANKKESRLKKTFDNGNKSIVVQGFDSKEVKYGKNLCHKCNSTKTQPYDKAYEVFISFLHKNHVAISKQEEVNLKLVYGKNVKSSQLDLFKYFAKAFGCAINDTQEVIPSGILDVIQGKSYGKDFVVTISKNKELLQKQLGLEGIIGCSDLEWRKENNSDKGPEWMWSQNIGWLVISYWCNWKVIDGGIPWNGKKKSIKFSQFIFEK